MQILEVGKKIGKVILVSLFAVAKNYDFQWETLIGALHQGYEEPSLWVYSSWVETFNSGNYKSDVLRNANAIYSEGP